jgi:hypothetical protein
MSKPFTFISDEHTDLRMLRFRLRKAIEADDAAILIEDEVPGSFHGAKYIGSVTRIEHRDTAIKELAEVELRLATGAFRTRRAGGEICGGRVLRHLTMDRPDA